MTKIILFTELCVELCTLFVSFHLSSFGITVSSPVSRYQLFHPSPLYSFLAVFSTYTKAKIWNRNIPNRLQQVIIVNEEETLEGQTQAEANCCILYFLPHKTKQKLVCPGHFALYIVQNTYSCPFIFIRPKSGNCYDADKEPETEYNSCVAPVYDNMISMTGNFLRTLAQCEDGINLPE